MIMFRKGICFLLVDLFVSAMFTPGWSQENTIGLIYSDTSRVCEGYTLFPPKHFTSTYLIDNQGGVVNSWENSTYDPGQSVYLLENGNLLRTCFDKSGNSTGGGEGGRIEEYDWDDNLVWEFDYSTEDYVSHHDIEPLPNGNILFLAVEKKTYAECVAAGFNPDYLQQVSSRGYILPDYVIEVEPTPPSGGNIVWEWHAWDHLVQDYDPDRQNYESDATSHPGLIDVNGMGEEVHYFWNHMNSIDYNAELNQIMLSVRGNSELWVIDHSTTTEEATGHSGGTYGKGGDILFRWGNPLTYGAGDQTDQTLFEQHDCQWIEPGCPGEGNILVFNNGLNRPDGSYSSVDEIVPPVDSNGFYALTAGSAFEPEEALWIYTTPNKTDFFSEAISGAQRLPNGNTLIDDGVHGTFWEVTPGKEIVWEYICPVDRNGPMTQGEEPELDHRGHLYNAVFKIHRYPPDYPAFNGRNMTPGDPVELHPVSIGKNDEIVRGRSRLLQNYPNPFNNETRIAYQLPETVNVRLAVHDITGRKLKILANGQHSAGKYEVTWNGTDNSGNAVDPGVYLYKLETDTFTEMKQMMLTK